MLKILTALAISSLTLAGCGGDSGLSFESAEDLAKAAGCATTEPFTEQIFTDDGATCDGLAAFIFRDNTNRDRWLEGARMFGSMGGAIVVGPKWIVQVMDKADAAAVVEKTGGTISE